MRREYSLRNSVTSVISNATAIVVNFLAQTVFIKVLGLEYLGVNSLFSNILMMFSFLELGIGSIITYKLYKPVHLNDVSKISSLMHFYKKAYYVISFFTFFIGLLIMPLVLKIAGDVNIDVNIYLVYLLFVLNLSISYLFSYKRSLIYVNQKNYIINIVHIFYLILMNLFQIILLIKTHNFYIYLITKMVFQLFENLVISFICDFKYPYMHDAKRLDKAEKKDIYNKILALMYHNGAYAVLCGSDNIIISCFFGLSLVGVYSNYYMVINAFVLLFGSIIEGCAASVGNLLISDKNRSYEVFRRLKFLNLWISIISSIFLLNVTSPFISLWLGKSYVLPFSVLFALCINYFVTLERKSYHIFKNAAGIWSEDKYVPVIESILNILFSIICLKFFGFAGVFIGTIISSMALYLYSYPKYVYKGLLKRDYMEYFRECFKAIFLFVLILLFTTFILSKVQNIVIIGLGSLLLPTLWLFILYRNDERFIYYKKMIFKR